MGSCRQEGSLVYSFEDCYHHHYIAAEDNMTPAEEVFGPRQRERNQETSRELIASASQLFQHYCRNGPIGNIWSQKYFTKCEIFIYSDHSEIVP